MGLLQSGVMWHLVDLQDGPEVRGIAKNLDDASVIGLEEELQGEHGQELVLREIPAGKLAGISRQRPLGNPNGHPGQRIRRPRHAALGCHMEINGKNGRGKIGNLQSTL